MTNERKQKRTALQEFLLRKYFGYRKEGYEVLKVDDFVLVKQIHGITKQPIIAVYSLENYKKSRKFLENPISGEGEHLQNIMQE